MQVEYPQDWLTNQIEDSGHKQADWRTDPAQSGAGGSIGDIGTHAHNLAQFVSGLEISRARWPISRPSCRGRKLDDNVQILLRYREWRARLPLGEPGRAGQ